MRGKLSATVSTVLLIATCAACGGDFGERLQSGRVLAWQGLQGRWAGDVVPIQPSCGSPTRGLMSVGGTTFGFDPFGGTEVVQGAVTTDGHFTGTLERQGGDRQDLSISFEAAARQPLSEATTIGGQLTSGRCQWTVTLHRA